MRGKGVLALAIAALIALNAWWYWPSPAAARRTSSIAAGLEAGFVPADFHLKASATAPVQATDVRRNVFALKLPAPARTAAAPKPVAAPASRPKTDAPAEPPPKTPEQLEEEAARAEFARLKLAAVVFRKGTGLAYLVKGDQTFMVAQGDTADRFTVESIGDEGVKLRDPRTNVGGLIPVSGK